MDTHEYSWLMDWLGKHPWSLERGRIEEILGEYYLIRNASQGKALAATKGK